MKDTLFYFLVVAFSVTLIAFMFIGLATTQGIIILPSSILSGLAIALIPLFGGIILSTITLD